MMSKEKKQVYISEMSTQLDKAEAVIVAHYQGLTVKQLDELRKKMREHGIQFKITKNRITKLALEKTSRKDLSKLGDALGDKLGAWLINNPSINANEHKDLSETKRIANAYYKYVHDDYDSLNTSWLYIDYANRFLQDKAKQIIHCIIPEVYEFNTNPPNWTSVINFHRFHQYWEENPRTPCNHAGPEAHKKFAKHLARLIT